VCILHPPLVNILNNICPALGGVKCLTQRAVSLGIGGSIAGHIVIAASIGIVITPPEVGGKQGGILRNTN
jgi:hypothetical protein